MSFATPLSPSELRCADGRPNCPRLAVPLPSLLEDVEPELRLPAAGAQARLRAVRALPVLRGEVMEP